MTVDFPYFLIDLTHTLERDCPSWNGSCGYRDDVKADYSKFEGRVKFKIQSLKMHAGIGTHLDAPSHAFPDGENIDQIPLSTLVASCVVIDVTDKMDELYTLSLDEVKAFEAKFGDIAPRSFVMVRTGWEKHWKHPKKYHNHHRFPSISGQVAEYLVEKQIMGIGIDTLSPDRPESGFPVHELILGAGKYIVENAANLKSLPIKGSFVMALPIKVGGCTEAPIRLVGLVPK